ncbi:MAG: GTPase, partial [Thermoprotei archaeon]
SPADISKLIKIDKPYVKVTWELKIVEGPSMKEIIDEFLERVKARM